MIPADQPRCMDESCPRRSDCARFLDRMNPKAKRVNSTMASKHGPDCFFFMPIPTMPAFPRIPNLKPKETKQ